MHRALNDMPSISRYDWNSIENIVDRLSHPPVHPSQMTLIRLRKCAGWPKSSLFPSKASYIKLRPKVWIVRAHMHARTHTLFLCLSLVVGILYSISFFSSLINNIFFYNLYIICIIYLIIHLFHSNVWNNVKVSITKRLVSLLEFRIRNCESPLESILTHKWKQNAATWTDRLINAFIFSC